MVCVMIVKLVNIQMKKVEILQAVSIVHLVNRLDNVVDRIVPIGTMEFYMVAVVVF